MKCGSNPIISGLHPCMRGTSRPECKRCLPGRHYLKRKRGVKQQCYSSQFVTHNKVLLISVRQSLLAIGSARWFTFIDLNNLVSPRGSQQLTLFYPLVSLLSAVVSLGKKDLHLVSLNIVFEQVHSSSWGASAKDVSVMTSLYAKGESVVKCVWFLAY